MYEQAPLHALSNGKGEGLFVGITQTNEKRRSLMAFDLDALEADAIVDTASIRMTLDKAFSTTQRIVVLRRLQKDWAEPDTVPISPEGAGAAALPGDCTWLNTGQGDSWNTPGGDFVPAPSAVGLAGPVLNTVYTWSGSGMIGDLNDWKVNGSSNYGWLVVGDEISGPQTAMRFRSAQHPDPASRPQLTVTYHGTGTPWTARRVRCFCVDVGSWCHL